MGHPGGAPGRCGWGTRMAGHAGGWGGGDAALHHRPRRQGFYVRPRTLPLCGMWPRVADNISRRTACPRAGHCRSRGGQLVRAVRGTLLLALKFGAVVGLVKHGYGISRGQDMEPCVVFVRLPAACMRCGSGSQGNAECEACGQCFGLLPGLVPERTDDLWRWGLTCRRGLARANCEGRAHNNPPHSRLASYSTTPCARACGRSQQVPAAPVSRDVVAKMCILLAHGVRACVCRHGDKCRRCADVRAALHNERGLQLVLHRHARRRFPHCWRSAS